MKKLTFAAGLCLALLSSACEEIPPTIGECQTERVVLIEEFTGVRCVNCPTGSAKIAQLLEQYSEQKLIAVSIHSGFFSVPYPQSTEDFTTEAGNDIDAMLGPVTAYPAACINRRLFTNETQRPLSLSSWAGYIGAELCRAPSLDLNINHSFDPVNRQVSATVNISPLAATTIDEPLAVTVYITENDIESAQLEPHGVNDNYIHKHVLRAVLTDTRGQLFHSSGAVEANTQRFNYTLPADWDATKCHLVAFIHYRGGGGKYDIIQAAHAHF